jgi:hypothetical protein
LKSDDIEHNDRVEVQAVLTSTGRQILLLEQIVSRLSLEPGVSGEILSEQKKQGATCPASAALEFVGVF